MPTTTPQTDELAAAAELAIGTTRALVALAHLAANALNALAGEIRRAEDDGIALPTLFEGSDYNEPLPETAEYLAYCIEKDGWANGESGFDFGSLLDQTERLTETIRETLGRRARGGEAAEHA